MARPRTALAVAFLCGVGLGLGLGLCALVLVVRDIKGTKVLMLQNA